MLSSSSPTPVHGILLDVAWQVRVDPAPGCELEAQLPGPGMGQAGVGWEMPWPCSWHAEVCRMALLQDRAALLWPW